MKQKISKFIAVLLAGIMIIFILNPVRASALDYDFSVRAIIPDNQVDKGKSYFDLLLNPGDKQIVEVEIKNSSDQEITVSAEISAATTNTNGVVEYIEREIEKDSTLLYPMEEYVHAEDTVKVAANGIYMLQMEVNMPQEEFDGVMAGGITIKQINDDNKEASAAGSGMAIVNKFAYTLGIVLHNNANSVHPSLELNDVFPNQVNYRNVISANVQNTIPAYVDGMAVDAKITKKNSNETLYEHSQGSIQMAPNSNFDLPVSLNGERMQAGDYTLYLTAEAMGDTWNWTKDFTITREQAQTFNETDVTLTEDNTWQYLLAGAVGALIIVAAIIVLIVSRSKKKMKRMQREMLLLKKRANLH